MAPQGCRRNGQICVQDSLTLYPGSRDAEEQTPSVSVSDPVSTAQIAHARTKEVFFHRQGGVRRLTRESNLT